MRPQMLYLHGIRGGDGPERWLSSLNATLRSLGEAEIDPADVIAPRYQAALQGTVPPDAPRSEPRRRAPAARPEARIEYEGRRQRFLAQLAADGPAAARFVPNPGDADPALYLSLFDEARRYRDDPAVRDAVRRVVLDEVPAGDRPLIVVGHSLGSVVAADVIPSLGRRIALLLTIGSPLGSVAGLAGLSKLGNPFRYSQIDLWVNVFDPRDPVDVGHGVGRRFPAAVDVPVTVDGPPLTSERHSMRSYAGHPVVARAVAFVDNDRALVRADREALQASVAGVEPALLQQAHLRQLEVRLATSADRAKVRLARRFLADRLAAALAAAATATGAHALTSDEILDSPDSLVVGRWNDGAFVPVLVSLAASPPAAPLEWRAGDPDARRRALVATVGAVRTAACAVPLRHDGSVSADISNDELVGAVLDALDAERRRRRGVPVRGILLVVGSAVLAATGWGVAAAVPAGLAGAAALTATLAAFGPGGMIGGIATLAALTGVSGAVFSAGAVLPSSSRSDGVAGVESLVDSALSLDPDAFSSSLSVARAVVVVQERLGFPSSRSFLRDRADEAVAALAPVAEVHHRVAKGSAAEKRVAANLEQLRDFAVDIGEGSPGTARAGS